MINSENDDNSDNDDIVSKRLSYNCCSFVNIKSASGGTSFCVCEGQVVDKMFVEGRGDGDTSHCFALAE